MQHFEYVHFGLIHRNRDIALSFAIQGSLICVPSAYPTDRIYCIINIAIFKISADLGSSVPEMVQ
mgnify:CR=1 FL=1